MLMEDSDDEPLLPGDVLASDKEIADAVAHARSDPAANRRLMTAAAFIWASSIQVKKMCEPEDLLQDACEAVLSGRWKWRTNRVDFKGLLIGVMRSMAFSRGKSLAIKAKHITMEHELHPQGEDQEPINLEETVADPETTESLILKKEEEAGKVCLLAVLRAMYGPKDLHGLILDKVNEGFSSHAEIREALGIADSAYWNAWKVLMRAAKNLNSSAKE